MDLTTFLVLMLIVAQFHPKGQEFLATDAGSAAFVGIAALAILSALPGAMLGHPFSVAVVLLWSYFSYPRLHSAKRYASTVARRIRRKLGGRP